MNCAINNFGWHEYEDTKSVRFIPEPRLFKGVNVIFFKEGENINQ